MKDTGFKEMDKKVRKKVQKITLHTMTKQQR